MGIQTQSRWNHLYLPGQITLSPESKSCYRKDGSAIIVDP